MKLTVACIATHSNYLQIWFTCCKEKYKNCKSIICRLLWANNTQFMNIFSYKSICKSRFFIKWKHKGCKEQTESELKWNDSDVKLLILSFTINVFTPSSDRTEYHVSSFQEQKVIGQVKVTLNQIKSSCLIFQWVRNLQPADFSRHLVFFVWRSAGLHCSSAHFLLSLGEILPPKSGLKQVYAH